MNDKNRKTKLLGAAALLAAGLATMAHGDWEFSGGPYNALVYDLLWNPGDTDTVYAATPTGVFTTTDGGLHWVRTSEGMDDTAIMCLGLAGNYPNVIYAGSSEMRNWYDEGEGGSDGSPYYGIYKSTDGGANWTRLLRFQQGLVESLAVNPNNPDILLACIKHINHGIWRSVDGGGWWDQTLDDSDPEAVAFAPSNPLIAFAAADGVVYKSSDGGVTWTEVLDGSYGMRSMAIHPTNPDIVLVGRRSTSQGMVWRTEDGGANWTEVLAEVGVNELVFDPSDGAVCYIASNGGSSGIKGGVYRSTNAGVSWEKLVYPAGKYANDNKDADDTTALAVNPFDGRELLAGNHYYGVIGTADQGSTWAYRRRGLSSLPETGEDECGVFAVAADPSDPQTRYVGAYGVWRWREGAGWEPLDGGLSDAEGWVQAIAICPSNPDIMCIATGYSGVWRSDDGGGNWINVIAGQDDFRDIAFSSSSDNVVYAVGKKWGTGWEAWKSIDRGATWQKVKDNGSDGLYSVAVDPTDPNRVFVGGEMYSSIEEKNFTAIWRSADGGSVWDEVYRSSEGGILEEPVYDIAIHPYNAAVIYGVAPYWDVIKSTDGGENWTEKTGGDIKMDLYEIAISPTDPECLYVAGDLLAVTEPLSVYFSDNGGSSWAPLGDGFPISSCYSVAVAPSGGTDYVIIGSERYGSYIWSEFTGARDVTFHASSVPRGVALKWDAPENYAGFNLYREGSRASADGGPVKINEYLITGSPPYAFLDGDVTAGETYRYWLEAVALAGGAERYGPAEAQAGGKRPFAFALGQNAPNPCRTAATISFSLAETGPARLELFDLAGRRVAVPIDRTVKAGPHSLALDVSTYPAGVYIYRLTAGDETASRRIVISK